MKDVPERRQAVIAEIADAMRRSGRPLTEETFYVFKSERLPEEPRDPDAMVVASVTWPDVQSFLDLA